jgi:hypothetical protein
MELRKLEESRRMEAGVAQTGQQGTALTRSRRLRPGGVLCGLAIAASLAAGTRAAERGGSGQAPAASPYPLTQAFDAKVESNETSITTVVTIRVNRLMEESRWKRVTDALKFGGYGQFFTTLRGLPAVGTIELRARKANFQYAREEKTADGRRLVLVADSPLFFLGETTKSRAGYELTIVELFFNDAKGSVTGTMTGAAKVKPSPSGVQLDDFADVRVILTGRKP